MSQSEQHDGAIRAHLTYYVNGRTTGDWHTFPTTQEKLEEFQRSLGAVTTFEREEIGVICETGIAALDYKLPRNLDLDELNHLAHILAGMSVEERAKLGAIMEADRDIHTMKDIINATHNLDRYELYPVPQNERDFGNLMAEKDADEFAEQLSALEASDSPEAQALAAYVKRLQDCVDPLRYGPVALAAEGGSRTSQGMIQSSPGPFEEPYTGRRDLPDNHRVAGPGAARDSLLSALAAMKAMEKPETGAFPKAVDRDSR